MRRSRLSGVALARNLRPERSRRMFMSHTVSWPDVDRVRDRRQICGNVDPGSPDADERSIVMVITRVGPTSCAKIAGTLYAILGLLMGGVFSLVALAGGFGPNSSERGALGAIIGVGSVIVFPVCYGAIGFVASLIGAWLYNILAGMVGGIQLDVQ